MRAEGAIGAGGRVHTMRPLDYDYLRTLSPAPQRFYELLSYQMHLLLVKIRLAIIAVILLAVFTTAASADLDVTVSVKTTPLPSGITTYIYLIVNNSTSTADVSGFSINTAENPLIKSISMRPSWDVDYSPEYASPYNPCGPSIAWFSLNPSAEVPPGSRVTFTFTSRFPPSEQSYTVYGWGHHRSMFRETTNGTIVGPGKEVACETQ